MPHAIRIVPRHTLIAALLPAFLLTALSCAPAIAAIPAAQPAKSPAPSQAQLAQTYGKLPLSFEANRGQSDSSVKFLSRGSGYSLYLTDSAAVLSLSKGKSGNADTVRMELSGANSQAKAAGADQLPGVSNYFIGNDPAKWHSSIPTYAKVRYASVYPGVDLVYYGNQHQLEYDFIVAPNADPSTIRLNFTGQKHLKIATNGDLILKGSNGEATLHKPVIYQEKDGQHQPIPGSFQFVANHSVRFRLGSYDRTQPLIIDPILVYSTFLGGAGTREGSGGPLFGDVAHGIAVDTDGDAYVVGTAASANFPVTTGSYQTTNAQAAAGNVGAVFVSKLNPTGTALLYSTYLSGTTTSCFQGNGQGCFGDFGFAIAVDAEGNAYITGVTFSTDFPVTAGAFQAANGQSAFIAKLNAAGTSLVYSTCLGIGAGYPETANGYGTPVPLDGNGTYGTSIAVDSHGDAFVTGMASAKNFPVTPGAYLTTNPFVAPDSEYDGVATTAFVTEMNPAGSAPVYSTFLGGANPVEANAIALDSSGSAYVTGTVITLYQYDGTHTSFPVTSGVLQTIPSPTTNQSNVGFVTKLNPTGTALEYSTFIGASSNAIGNAITVDAAGNAYVAGYSDPTFPVTTSTLAAGNGFVAKLNPEGSAYEYASFVGGEYADPTGVAVDTAGNAYVAGTSNGVQNASFYAAHAPYYLLPSTQGAMTIAADPNLNIGPLPFVAKLAPDGATEQYASVFGGNPGGAAALALDSSGSVYIAGSTGDTQFTTTKGAIQTVKGTHLSDQVTTNAFVTKLALAGETTGAYPTGLQLSPSANLILSGQPVTLTATVTSAPGGATPTGNVTFFPIKIGTGDAASLPFPPATAALDANGVAVVIVTPVTVGIYEALAAYSGDATHLTSLPPPEQGNANYVGLTPAEFEVAPGPNGMVLNRPSARYGQMVTLSAQLYFPSESIPQGFPVTFTAPPGLILQSASATPNANGFAYVTATASKPGSYTWIASVIGNQVAGTSSAVFSPANLTVTLHNIYRLYGAANPAFSPLISGLVGSDIVTVTPQTTATPASPVGTYPVTATVTGPDTANYNLTVNGATLSISKAPLYISARNVAVTYGQTPPPITSYILTGFTNGDTASVVSGAPVLTTTVTDTTPVGVYKIGVQVGTLTAANYYFDNFSGGEGAVEVYKAPLSIAAKSIATTYGQAPPQPTAYTIAGFVNGDTQATSTTGAPALSTTVTATTPAGTYPITVGAGTLSAANYYFKTISSGEGSVEVAKAPLTILPASFTIHAGDPLPTFTYSITGFVNGDTQATATTGAPTLTTTAPNNTTPGRYSIVANTGSLAATNYYFNRSTTATDGILTILPN